MASKLEVVKTPASFPKNSTFPPPHRMKVQDSSASPRRCAEFFEYWKSLTGTVSAPKERADLIEVRWYLHRPKISMKLIDPSRKNNVFQIMSGPLWFEDPEDYFTEVPKKLGAGRYHVCINEAGIRGALMEAYFDVGDWDEYPPKVDLRTLLRNDPENEDYLRWLSVNNIRVPWDTPKEDEEDEMAGEAAKVAVDAISDFAERAMEAKDREVDARIEVIQEQAKRMAEEKEQPAGTIDAAVVNAGMELLANAANKSIDMVAQHAGSQLNTVEVMKTAAELFRPKEDNSGISMLVEALKDQNAKMLEMQASNQEFMRSVIGMKKNPDGSWSAGAEHQSGGIEGELARFQRLADVLGWQKPGREIQHQQSVPQVEHPPEKGILTAIAENIGPFSAMVTTVTVLIANMVYNFRAEPGKAMSPQEAMQKAQANAPPVQQQPQPQQIDPRDIRNWMTFAKQIEPAFKTHFRGQDQGLSGFTFAEFLLSNATGGAATPEGRKVYMSIKENLGPQGFDRLVRATPALWNEVQATPDSYRKFIEEFFSYDEMVAQQQPAGAAV